MAILFASVAIFGAAHHWPGAVAKAQTTGKVSVEAYAQWGEFWAAVINAVLCAGLALFWSSSWARKADARVVPPEMGRAVRLKGWEWLLLIGLLAGAGALRWGRMDLSLYNDEAHTFRRYIGGHFKTESSLDPADWRWRPVSWTETLWLDQVANNSMPCSLFGRLGYETWRKLIKARDGALWEPAIRLQAWLGGMGSLVFLWLLVRRLWPGGAAWWGLVLAGLHPWHVRYSTEARGYGLLLCGVAACCYFLVRAWEDNRWRSWLGFGASQFLCLWSFPGAVYWLAVLEVMLLSGLVARALRGDASPLLRSLSASILGAILAIQWMLPTIPQLVAATQILESMKGEMGMSWWKDVAGGLGWGVRWVDADPENPWNFCLQRLGAVQPLLTGLCVAGVVLLLLGGIVVLCRRGGVGWMIALSGPAAVVLGWAVMSRDGKYLHSWYVLYALPGLLAGWGGLTEGLSRPWWRKMAPILLVAVFLPIWGRVNARNLRMGKENLKGVAHVLDEHRRKDSLEPALIGVYTDIDVYEPGIHIINTVKELEGMITEAKSSGRLLFVTYGRRPLMEGLKPELVQRLRGSDFMEFPPVYGLEEEQFTHRVFRLR